MLMVAMTMEAGSKARLVNMNDINKDFENTAKQVRAKLIEAAKLIEEADTLAGSLTIRGVDSNAYDDLQTVLQDAGFVTEVEVEAWNSSGCFY
jgi:hypothetical protein